MVSNYFRPTEIGGAEMLTALLADALAARGHEIMVVTTCGPEQDGIVEEQQGTIAVRRFFPPNVYWGYERKRRPGWQKLAWHLRDAWNPAAGRTFEALLDGFRPDIVHTHNIDGFSPVIWSATRGRSIPVVHTAHDYHLLCPKATLLRANGEICTSADLLCRVPYRPWYRKVSESITVFCSPSQFLLDQHRDAGLRPDRFALVHNGTPQSDAAEPAPFDGTLRLLYSGQLSTSKGVGLLLAAWRLLPKELPVSLDLTGKGPLTEEVAQAAAEDSRLRPHGFVTIEEKEALFRRSHVLLFPSIWYENAPASIIEARTAGMALLVSKVGAIPEFVEDGRFGLHVPPADPVAWRDAIVRLSQSPSLVTNLRARARHGIEHFSVDAMAARYEAIYSSVT